MLQAGLSFRVQPANGEPSIRIGRRDDVRRLRDGLVEIADLALLDVLSGDDADAGGRVADSAQHLLAFDDLLLERSLLRGPLPLRSTATAQLHFLDVSLGGRRFDFDRRKLDCL